MADAFSVIKRRTDMIFDSLKNVDTYKGLPVYDALKFFAENDLSEATPGRYELEGEDYYFINEYETNAKTRSEAHKDFIDIQIMLKGEEYIGVAPLTEDMEVVDCADGKDCWFYDCPVDRVAMKPGYFMVLYPQDVHMPGDMMNAPTACKKIVGKIKVK
jgi:YhcH/YjgK/YiaL family protein